MHSNTTIAITSFRESAVRIFLLLWNDFERKTKELDRKTDENVFQQLQYRYVEGLRAQLSSIAERTLMSFSGDLNGLRKCLTDQVSQNISAFMFRAKAI